MNLLKTIKRMNNKFLFDQRLKIFVITHLQNTIHKLAIQLFIR